MVKTQRDRGIQSMVKCAMWADFESRADTKERHNFRQGKHHPRASSALTGEASMLPECHEDDLDLHLPSSALATPEHLPACKAGPTSGSSRATRRTAFCMDKNLVSHNLCVLRSTRAGCTLGNSKAGAAATGLPRGHAKPTEASDLDIHNVNDGWAMH